jgi:lysophospholipase L1-like esterase
VTKRRHVRAVAAGAALIACCLLLSFWLAARAQQGAASQAVSSVALLPQGTGPGTAGPPAPGDVLTVSAPLAACEARLERQARRLPAVAIVGASYTAGVGPDNPELSWAVQLARQLHWNAVIEGVPGAGYVRDAPSGRGPMARLLGEEGLRGLRPALVIVQAGHDDLGVPLALERARVAAALDQIRASAPGARIALLTAFSSSPDGTPALWQTDRAIVTAAAAAGPGVIVMDPLAEHWRYARAGNGGLHPNAAGDLWIARTVAGVLRGNGLRPAPQLAGTPPVICDVSVGAGKARGTVA